MICASATPHGFGLGQQVARALSPPEVTCEEFFQADFPIERLTEPAPLPEVATVDPSRYERESRSPSGFIAFRQMPRVP
jgi:hypothetical protein